MKRNIGILYVSHVQSQITICTYIVDVSYVILVTEKIKTISKNKYV